MTPLPVHVSCVVCLLYLDSYVEVMGCYVNQTINLLTKLGEGCYDAAALFCVLAVCVSCRWSANAVLSKNKRENCSLSCTNNSRARLRNLTTLLDRRLTFLPNVGV
jgi:hypothetical protein